MGTLAGVRIGVTGARRGPQLCAALERRGAVALHGPTIEPDQPAPDAELLPQLEQLLAERPDWFVATTGTGVRLLSRLAQRHGLREQLVDLLGDDDVRVVARGAKAVGGLRGIGVTPDHVASEETDASVAAWLAGVLQAGDRLAVQYSARTRRHYERLRDGHGVDLQVLRPYRTGVPTDPSPAVELVAAAAGGDLDVVICTSAVATDNLVRIAADHDLLEDVAEAFSSGRPVAAAIGSVTADAFRDHGIEPGIIPQRHRTGSLLVAIEDWATQRRR